MRSLTRRLGEESNQLVRRLDDGLIANEPDLTSRLLERWEATVEGHESDGIAWRSRVLTDRGKGAEEKRYGADFAGVVQISLPDFKVNKGFLAQSKRCEPGELEKRRWVDLVGQCEKMMNISPDSFVFLYSVRKGVRIIPSITVLGLAAGPGRDPFAVYSRSVSSFFELHFECFVGDPFVGSPKVDLEEVLLKTQARSAFLVEAVA